MTRILSQVTGEDRRHDVTADMGVSSRGPDAPQHLGSPAGTQLCSGARRAGLAPLSTTLHLQGFCAEPSQVLQRLRASLPCRDGGLTSAELRAAAPRAAPCTTTAAGLLLGQPSTSQGPAVPTGARLTLRESDDFQCFLALRAN